MLPNSLCGGQEGSVSSDEHADVRKRSEMKARDAQVGDYDRMLPNSLSCSLAGEGGGEGSELLASDEQADVRKRSEMKARDAQVGDYDRMWYLNLFGAIEIPMTLGYLSPEPHHTMLEAGCGTGRMTRSFAERCDQLVSIDFSLESLKVNARKLHHHGVKNVLLVQADLCRLPFKTNAFDRVVSCQVLEHIPTPRSREAAVGELARVLDSGGTLVLSAYQHSLLTKLFGQKEGEHEGGIPFFRFERAELRALLERELKVEHITGKLVYHYTACCRKVVGSR
jgi:ubiquinone/menaquinone biosynthesis C-methylase UbiE